MSDYDTVDFFRDQSLVADPYPYFAHVRSKCPVWREPNHDVVMVTGYEEACAVYQDPETFSSANSVTGPFPGVPEPLVGDAVSDQIEAQRDRLPFSDQLPTFDPPKHKEHRALLMRLLTPARLREDKEALWRGGGGAARRPPAGRVRGERQVRARPRSRPTLHAARHRRPPGHPGGGLARVPGGA